MQQVSVDTYYITSFRQSGKCILYYIEDLRELENIKQEGLIGCGSNVIIHRSQELYKLSKNFSYLKFYNDLAIIGGASRIKSIIKECTKRGFSGLEFLAGVPASIGGCVSMNAGAFGSKIEDYFEYAICYSQENGIHTVDKNQARFRYRGSNFRNKIILEVGLRLKKMNSLEIEAKMKQNIKNRLSKAPLSRTFGSVFKNSDKYIAGRLIEESGLRGKTVNDAMISKKHANYIINLNKATSNDVLNLIDIAQNSVYKNFNIILEEEVVIL